MKALGASMRQMSMVLAVLLGAMATFWHPAAALAQEGLPRVVMIVKVKVAPENHDAFREWIAEFRALAEVSIADGKLSPTDMCAYKSWRVLGPDPAGLNKDFFFVFEPVIPIANYLLAHYVNLALDGPAAAEMMMRWNAMADQDPEVLYASPLDPSVDAVNLGEVCEF